MRFYEHQKSKPKREDQVNIITKSLERLINRQLIIGFGVRTAYKWFIKEVQLTYKGRRVAKKLIGQQQRLPLKISKRHNL